MDWKVRLKVQHQKKSDGKLDGRRTIQKQDDSCGVCGKRVMANSVLCIKCGNYVHGRCAK